MFTPQQIEEMLKTFGPFAGSLLLFIGGLKFGWWHMDGEVQALLKAKDAIIAVLTAELTRERETSDYAAKSVRETIDWALSKTTKPTK